MPGRTPGLEPGVDLLFVGVGGRALSGGQLYSRLKVVQQNVESAELRAKVIGLHTLRHAIAALATSRHGATEDRAVPGA